MFHIQVADLSMSFISCHVPISYDKVFLRKLMKSDLSFN